MSQALKNFTDGIKHLVQTAIEQAPFDKTYNGRVLAVDGNKYTVLINGKEYPNTAVQGGGNFAVNEIVKVVFPQNNSALRYIDNAGEGGASTVGTVRYDTAQSLTEAQKVQARANIGAGTGGSDEVYIVHITLANGEYQFAFNESWDAIYDALYNSDKAVVAEVWDADDNDEQYVYSFCGYSDINTVGGRRFVFSRAEGNQIRYLYVHTNNTISAEVVDLDGGGDNTFVVKLSEVDDVITSDKTFAEIKAAKLNGKVVIADYLGYTLYAEYSAAAAGIVSFIGQTVLLDDVGLNYIYIDSSDVWHTDSFEIALKSEIGELSDLDTTDKSSIVAAINEVVQSGGGTSDHSQLSNRDVANQHPMSAITGLENEFGMVRDTFEGVFNDLNNKLSDAPSDGKTYGRKNGAWNEVQGGSGNNCEVKISYANNTYSADKTRNEIAEAIADGEFVYAVYDNVYYYYDSINNASATFKRTFVDVDEVQDITFDIYNDHVSREDITFANVMNVEVEENDGEYTAYVGTETVSFADIEVAINNNRTVVVTFENNKYPLSGFGNDVAQFVNTTINTSMALVEEDVFVIAPDGVFRSDSVGQYTKLSVFDALEARVSELEEHGGGGDDGSQYMQDITTNATSNTIPIRNANGTFSVGTATANSEVANFGDIKHWVDEHYKPVVLYTKDDGLLVSGTITQGHSAGVGLSKTGASKYVENNQWNIEGMDLTPYKKLRIVAVRDSANTASTFEVMLPLDYNVLTDATNGNFAVASGSSAAFGDRNRINYIICAARKEQGQFAFCDGYSLYGTAATTISAIHVVKIEGYKI